MKDWEKNVRKVIPYVPGEQPNEVGMIKLNTNENPYPPSEKVKKAISEFNPELLRLYPDPKADLLTTSLADYYGISNEEVFVGVGSDDVLAMIFLTFFNSSKPILFPDITYSFYDVWADLFRIPYEMQKLDENFNLVAKDYKKENGGIIFPNPNAPTGVLVSLDFIEDIVKSNPDVIVVIDEAYIDFGGVSALPLIQKYDNLLVVSTFSKSRCMAGIRIGCAMGSKELIRYLNDVKYSFNSYTMNQPAIAYGYAALQDEEYFRETIAKIIATREWTKKELRKLGFSFSDSCSNFIFATHEKYRAADIFAALRKEHIYVRYFNKPRIDNYLRITIGTDEEMEKLIEFLKKYIK